jgi:transcriptional regulator with XRE-family HTH domain
MDIRTLPILERLREAREQLGLSQAQLAGYLGISQNSYKEIEKGNTSLKVQTLLELCDILKLNIIELFEPPPPKAESQFLVLDSEQVSNLLLQLSENVRLLQAEVAALRQAM